jgi:hypothetical protein
LDYYLDVVQILRGILKYDLAHLPRIGKVAGNW